MAAPNRPTHVPRFGNWDPNDHAPYTKVFETARAGRGGKLINPNDPAQNPEAFKPAPPPPPPVGAARRAENEPVHPRRTRGDRNSRDSRDSREDGEYKRYMESPVRKPSRTTSNNRSPLHPSAGIKGGSSPALPKFGDWDAKDPSSGEGFTMIFNNARNERQVGGPGRIPPMGASVNQQQNHHRNSYSSPKRSKSWFCCLS